MCGPAEMRTSQSSRGAGGCSLPPPRLPLPVAPALVLVVILVMAATGCAAAKLSVQEMRSILDKWRPEIHGAVAAKVGEIPYQASIRHYSPQADQHKCGGAVVSAWHVLTAARCVPYSTSLIAADSMFVVVGTVTRSSLDQGDVDTVVRKVASIVKHPDYSSREQRHDLALLTLSKPLPMDRKDRIDTIPLPLGGIQVQMGSSCVVSGWGNNTGTTQLESDSLLSAEVPFIDRDLCAQLYEPAPLAEGVVCTAHQRGGAGACVGDTGGPLVCSGFLAGTVSWGSGCGPGAKPTVYTSLAEHVEWVREQMALHSGQRGPRGPAGPRGPQQDAGGVSSASTAPRRSLATPLLAAVLAITLVVVLFSPDSRSSGAPLVSS